MNRGSCPHNQRSNINFSSDGYSVEYPFFCLFSGRLRMKSYVKFLVSRRGLFYNHVSSIVFTAHSSLQKCAMHTKKRCVL